MIWLYVYLAFAVGLCVVAGYCDWDMEEIAAAILLWPFALPVGALFLIGAGFYWVGMTVRERLDERVSDD